MQDPITLLLFNKYNTIIEVGTLICFTADAPREGNGVGRGLKTSEVLRGNLYNRRQTGSGIFCWKGEGILNSDMTRSWV